MAPGETVALLGESGSGKTTLLNAIAGFVPPLAGEIWLAGELASGPGRSLPPERRRIGMVFQDHALWPHLSVLDTVAYPLRRAGASRAAARRDALAIVAQLNLGPLAGRRPGQLSGGEQQRVGLARALACHPAVYLFDEPTAHLDASLRAQILDEVARRRAADGAAAIYATHDAAEALAIAGQVAVLHSGAMAQAGPPAVVYAEPGDLTVARLTGPVSVLGRPGPRGRAWHVHDRGGRGTGDRARGVGAGAGPAAPGAGPAAPGDPGPPRLGPARRRPARPRRGGQVPRAAHRLPRRHAGRPAADPGARPAPGCLGPVRWSLLRARLMPRERPAGPKAADPGDLRP